MSVDPASPYRRLSLKLLAWLLGSVAVVVVALLLNPAPIQQSSMHDFQSEIKIGLLHSTTGTMAVSENPAIAGEILAVEEINASGGILLHGKSHKLIPTLRDGASDPAVFAQRARELVEDEGVSVVFGGWTSSSRKAMLPIFERNDSLLFYPIQYEGGEQAEHVLYFGATPNQQAAPVLEWAFSQGVSDFFLVGSDYVYPRTVNQALKQEIARLGGSIRGELYLPLGARVSANHIAQISERLPRGGILINTVNGDSNESLFRGLNSAYLLPQNGFYTVSFSIDEATIKQLGSQFFAGGYISQGFFESLDLEDAKHFIQRYKRRFGIDRAVSEPAAAGYTMVRSWADAVARADSVRAKDVLEAIQKGTHHSPAGPIRVLANQHVIKPMFLGQVDANGGITLLKHFGERAPEPDWPEGQTAKTQK